MTQLGAVALIVFVIALGAAAAVWLLGLCKAAADLRDVEPDTGEYND